MTVDTRTITLLIRKHIMRARAEWQSLGKQPESSWKARKRIVDWMGDAALRVAIHSYTHNQVPEKGARVWRRHSKGLIPLNEIPASVLLNPEMKGFYTVG